MNFDFALFLVIATAVTGIIWAVDSLFFNKKRMALADMESSEAVARATEENAELSSSDIVLVEKAEVQKPLLVDYAESFFPVLLLVLVIRSFIGEPFRIPSGSMFPTLLVGDFILVNKFSYGIKLPVLDTKIIETGEPERGDIVVFRYPQNPKLDYIKRVVGLPGDRVSYINKELRVNGELVSNEYVGVYEPPDGTLPDSRVGIYNEKLGEANHQILMTKGKSGVEGETMVPEGKYFVMGDNRDNSNDSRYWGFVPEENFRGKAIMIWMNWDAVNTSVMWSRIGSMLN